MIWSLVQTVGQQGVTFIIMSLLARLLSPADFGILAMANVWLLFIQVLSELGFGAALIQKRQVTDEYCSSVFFVNVGMGLILTLAGWGLSGPCALFFSNPRVQPVMAALSVGVLINSFSLTQVAINQKRLNFKALALRDVSAVVLGGVLGVTAAVGGLGVWSLVVQSLTTNLLRAIVIWRLSEWRPHVREFSVAHVRELWGYGSQIFAFNVFKFFAQNADKLVIGHLLGAAALGLYSFAFTIVVQPVAILVGAIGVYLFPRFSLLQDESQRGQLKGIYALTTKAISVLTAPWLLFIALTASPLVHLAWGGKWGAAVPLMRVFCGMAFLIAFVSPTGQIMKALNRPSWLFIYSVFVTGLGVVFIVMGIKLLGIVGAAYGITLAYFVCLPANFLILVKLIPFNVREIFQLLWPIPKGGERRAIVLHLKASLSKIIPGGDRI